MNDTIAQTTTAADEAPTPMTADPHMWVAVAFVIFIAVFVKFILPPINRALDKRAADIAHQLELANRLRAEAEALMAQSKIQQEAMLREAEEILLQAKKDADEIAVKAENDLAQTMARRRVMADETIERAKANALRDMRDKMVEIASVTARQVVIAQLKDQPEDPAIAAALQSIANRFH